ncbi:MAG: arginyltransferase [Polyangiales bacterium]
MAPSRSPRDRYFPLMRTVVVHSEIEPCPYLPGEQMRLPYRLPVAGLTGADFDQLLAEGDRRSGPILYRPSCPTCHACEAIRVPVREFQPTRSQRRAARKNAPDVRVEIAPPIADARIAEIYGVHKRERRLEVQLASPQPTTVEDLQRAMFTSCVGTALVRYAIGDHLIAFSVLDVGDRAASSVYHAFDPQFAWRSLGVFSVLAEIALCRELGLDWYYLGLYVERCDRLKYKAEYTPNERLIDGAWTRFDRAAD